MSDPVRVLVIGCGNMGGSHARAYHAIDGFEICGLVSPIDDKEKLAVELGGDIPLFEDVETALRETKPEAVCVASYTDTHEAYALAAMEAGANVFVEKPVAPTAEGAERVVAAARKAGKALVVGYILRHHPSWQRFIEIARTMGKPLVMRMNLNQQSCGPTWETHKKLINATPPVVDCGVHYVDVMCQMTGSRPVRVNGVAAKLADDIDEKSVNYGHLQVVFEDGSIGWYEAGWGPMMSENAFFVKDVVGPKGCVSIMAKEAGGAKQSDNVDAHTKTESLLVHHAKRKQDGCFSKEDEWIDMSDEPDHNELCRREQAWFLRAIREGLDLSDHWRDAVNSLKIVLAADESARTGDSIRL